MKFLLKILNKLKLLNKLIIHTKININHKQIVVPIIGCTGYNNLNLSERWMLQVLKLLDLPDEKLIVDVGVNIGQTLIKIKSVYPHPHYIGFEPNPNCLFYLEKLIKANNWKSTEIIPSGVAHQSGVVFLDHYSDDITDSSASIVENYRADAKVFKREMVNLLDVKNIDEVFKDKNISVIKIDVEGSELGVIQSFKDKIAKDRPFLLVEILPTYDENNVSRLASQKEIEKILKSLDYIIYRIAKNSDDAFKKLIKIKTIEIHGDLSWCDYVFSPKVLELK